MQNYCSHSQTDKWIPEGHDGDLTYYADIILTGTHKKEETQFKLENACSFTKSHTYWIDLKRNATNVSVRTELNATITLVDDHGRVHPIGLESSKKALESNTLSISTRVTRTSTKFHFLTYPGKKNNTRGSMQFKLDLELDIGTFTWWSQPFVVFSTDKMRASGMKNQFYVPTFPYKSQGDMYVTDSVTEIFQEFYQSVIMQKIQQQIVSDVIVDMNVAKKKKVQKKTQQKEEESGHVDYGKQEYIVPRLKLEGVKMESFQESSYPTSIRSSEAICDYYDNVIDRLDLKKLRSCIESQSQVNSRENSPRSGSSSWRSPFGLINK
jgi:hypothetical protein